MEEKIVNKNIPNKFQVLLAGIIIVLVVALFAINANVFADDGIRVATTEEFFAALGVPIETEGVDADGNPVTYQVYTLTNNIIVDGPIEITIPNIMIQGDITDKKNLRTIGRGTSDNTLLSVNEENFVLKNVRFDGKEVKVEYNYTAGGLTISNNTCILENLIFENCNNRYSGAAIRISRNENGSDDIRVNITDCEFYNNRSDRNGGAIYTVSDIENINTYLTKCIFENNTSQYGGAILHNSAKAYMYLEDCIFINNVATFAGGAVRGNDYTVLSVKDCDFIGNVTGGAGGAISKKYNNLYVDGGTFLGNKAKLGGAIMKRIDKGEIFGEINIPCSEDGSWDFEYEYLEKGVAKTIIIEMTEAYNEICVYDEVSKRFSAGNSDTILSGIPYFRFYNSSTNESIDLSKMKEDGTKIGYLIIESYPEIKIAEFNTETNDEIFTLFNVEEDESDKEHDEENKELKIVKSNDVVKYEIANGKTLVKTLADVSFFEKLQNADFEYDKSKTSYTYDPLEKYEVLDRTASYYERVKKYKTRIGKFNVAYEFLKDVNLEYSNNTSIGEATVVITPKENSCFSGTYEKKFKIICDLSKLDVSDIEEDIVVKYFDGTDVTFEVNKLKVGERNLTEDDYELSIPEGASANLGDDVDIILTGKGDYFTGSITLSAKTVTENVIYIEKDKAGEKVELAANLKKENAVVLPDSFRKVVIKANIEETELEKEKEGKIESSSAYSTQQKQIGTYDIYITMNVDDAGDEKVELSKEIEVELKIPYDRNLDYSKTKIYHIKNDGALEVIVPTYQKVTTESSVNLNFKVSSFSEFAVYTEEKEVESSSSSSASSNVTQSVTVVQVDHENIISGFSDKTFRPNKYITRSEVAAILARIDDNYKDTTNYKGNVTRYDDITTSHWASNYFGYMIGKGIITGNGNKLDPNGECTRAEIAKIICNYKNINQVGKTSSFTDANGRWYDEYVGALEELKYMEGYSDGTFRGTAKLTRAEFSKLICIMEDRVIENTSRITTTMKTIMKNKYTDLNESSWYYPYVLEISYDHSKSLLH